MKLKFANGGAELAVSDAIFGKEFNEALVHQVVTAYRNAGRSGTKAQLTKAEVRGGGRKPRPQKGGGTSRAGSIRSPIWVGGGRAFAAKPRSFEQKVNKKMYRGALQSMLSELVRQDRLVVTRFVHRGRAQDQAGRRAAQETQARARAHRSRGHRREAVPRRAQPAARRSAAGVAPRIRCRWPATTRCSMTVRRRETHRGASAMSAAKAEKAAKGR